MPRSTTLLHRFLGDARAFPILTSLYPPLAGAGIRVRSMSRDWTRGELEMRIRPWTANHNGTAFGGALFSATDVLYGTMLAGQLGGRYRVATKEATVRFLRPGKGRLRCAVTVPQWEATRVRDILASENHVDVHHFARLLDDEGRTVCEAEHVLRVKRKGNRARNQ